MRILRKPADAAEIGDPALRRLVEQRFAEIGEDGCFDTETMGNFIVVEAGDSARQIEAESGCPILTDCFGEARYGDADFTPAFEWAMAHVAAGIYELAFVFNDDGYGALVFVPNRDGVDADLLAMCAEYATPEPEEAMVATPPT